MASIGALNSLSPANSSKLAGGNHFSYSFPAESAFLGTKVVSWNRERKNNRGTSNVVVAAGELSSDSTTYLIAGAAVVTLVGTAFPIFFSRKDTCPECDGAGFVRKSSVTLRANAARKDQAQIVCANCNGLGKLNQVDK